MNLKLNAYWNEETENYTKSPVHIVLFGLPFYTVEKATEEHIK